MEEDVIPDFCSKPALILGCGNVFFGDDGFGCALTEYLETHFDVPGSVCLLDAGTRPTCVPGAHVPGMGEAAAASGNAAAIDRQIEEWFAPVEVHGRPIH